MQLTVKHFRKRAAKVTVVRPRPELEVIQGGPVCSTCKGEKHVEIACCSGRDCGCGGGFIIEPCTDCELDGPLEPDPFEKPWEDFTLGDDFPF